MKRILILFALLSFISVSVQAQFSTPTGQLVHVQFSDLSAITTDGSLRYCENCSKTNPATAGGSGAFCKLEAGAWNCSISATDINTALGYTAANAATVATNTSNIATNTSAIATNNTNIASNTSAIATKLTASNNLSDVANLATSRANLAIVAQVTTLPSTCPANTVYNLTQTDAAGNAPGIYRGDASGNCVASDTRAGESDLARSALLPLISALSPAASSLAGAVDSAAAASMSGTGGTFAAWGSPVGVQASFNRIEFDIQTWDVKNPVNEVRVRVRDTNSTGTILGETTVGVYPTINTPYRVAADFPSAISSSNPLWVEFYMDGYAGVRASTYAYTVAGGYPAAVWTNTLNIVNLQTLTGSSSGSNFWFRFSNSAARTWEISNPTAFVNESSTYAGWGVPIGARQNFNRVEFDIRAWDASAPISQVRVRIFQNNQSGAMLADRNVTVQTVSTSGVIHVVCDLAQTIVNSAATPLWLDFQTDGRTGYRALSGASIVYTTGAGFANSAYTTILLSTPQPATWVTVSTHTNMWVRVSKVGIANHKIGQREDVKANLKSVIAEMWTPNITLPSMIYAVQGLESNLYFENVVRSDQSTASGYDAYNYDVTSNRSGTEIGQQQNYRWTATPVAADVGDRTLTLDMWWAAQKRASKATTLRIKGPTTSAVTRKLLAIGDSTTAGGQWLAELTNLSGGSGLTVTTVGTVATTVADASGTSRTVNHEGRSGQTVNWFYTNASSPFVFSGSFNFATYLTTNSITLASNDWVIIALGVNDVFNATTDTSANTTMGTMKTQLDAMISNIRTSVSGVRVGVSLVIPPVHDQDGFGAAYGNAQTQWRYKRNRDLLNEFLINNYDALTASNQYIVPMMTNLDARNNFPTTSSAINAYNATTISRQSNGVHLANMGYYQMGAGYYFFLRGQEP